MAIKTVDGVAFVGSAIGPETGERTIRIGAVEGEPGSDGPGYGIELTVPQATELVRRITEGLTQDVYVASCSDIRVKLATIEEDDDDEDDFSFDGFGIIFIPK